ncbi:hypothetical protein BUALT_Bualt17G0038200 [Buddleja alternifolia]|uniref:Uncharacterized protein n=1 Tax=Buddleja alternifolia TaxID=168488 RepID=A0AAV6WGF0_9LAMI|nr:hypothetical protein BUALT_Bualt17G0038200 [Buddleja alternifolia]
MEFMMNGKKVALRGRKPAVTKMIDHSKMKKLLHKPARIAMLHVDVITQVKGARGRDNNNPYDPGDTLKLCALEGENCSGNLAAITSASTDLLTKIKASWNDDPMINKIITDLKDNSNSHPRYELKGGILTRKGKLVVGNSVDVH